MKQHKRRTKILAYSALQRPWAVLIGLVSLSGALAGMVSLIVIPIVVSSFSDRKSYVQDLLIENLASCWPWLLVALVLFGMFASYLGIYYSNRFAGPIWSLERFLNARLNGEKITPIKFREKDMVGDLQELLNGVFGNVARIEDRGSELLRLLDQMVQGKNKEELAELVRAIEEFRAALEDRSPSEDQK